MTGIFTYRNFSLRDTPALDGQVAVVTVCLPIEDMDTTPVLTASIPREAKQASDKASRTLNKIQAIPIHRPRSNKTFQKSPRSFYYTGSRRRSSYPGVPTNSTPRVKNGDAETVSLSASTMPESTSCSAI